jgi:hypothetical protein
MIKRHIENLRAKPEHIRERYALIYTAILSLIIFGVWFSSLSYTFNNINGDQKLAQKDNVPDPITTTLAPIKDNFNEIKSGWAAVIKSVNFFK